MINTEVECVENRFGLFALVDDENAKQAGEFWTLMNDDDNCVELENLKYHDRVKRWKLMENR